MIRRIAALAIGIVLMTMVPATHGHAPGISSTVSPEGGAKHRATADVVASEARARSSTCCSLFYPSCWRSA
jgi:hypothetical protein